MEYKSNFVSFLFLIVHLALHHLKMLAIKRPSIFSTLMQEIRNGKNIKEEATSNLNILWVPKRKNKQKQQQKAIVKVVLWCESRI